MRVYLAGPDVFLPDPIARGAALKAVCARHGLVGVFPLDDPADTPAAWQAMTPARRIALCNEAHIAGCNALVANLTPFRGPSADVGTVFELGFMRALGRPVFGWSNTATLFHARTRSTHRPVLDVDGAWRDGAGMAVEDFACHDNLMIDGAIIASGGVLVAREVPEGGRWTDLDAFEAAVAALAERLACR